MTVGTQKIITVKGAAEDIVAYYDDEGAHNYPERKEVDKVSDTFFKLTEYYLKDTFNADDYVLGIKTIDASAVTHDLAITGNKNANTILGGFGNDTLIGGGSNDLLDGDGGSDVFIYNDGDGNDTIVGYTQGEDRIVIASGSVSDISVSGSNVIFTVGKGKIVVKDGTEQLITWVDADGKEHFYPDEVSFSDDGKQATILSSYHKSAFDISAYGSYGTTVQTINAAAVTHDVSTARRTTITSTAARRMIILTAA